MPNLAALLLFNAMLAPPSAQPTGPNAPRCVEFATEDRLNAGESFTASLERALEHDPSTFAVRDE